MTPDDPASLLILELAKSFGIPPVTVALMIPLMITFANRAARLIPDNATGPLKWLRIAFSIVGIHVKDNTGVPAVPAPDGTAVRRSAVETLPTDESVEDHEQGVLLLDQPAPTVPEMFRTGAAALQTTQKED